MKEQASCAGSAHEGSAATLEDVAQRYDNRLPLGLSVGQVADLAQYLKSL